MSCKNLSWIVIKILSVSYHSVKFIASSNYRQRLSQQYLVDHIVPLLESRCVTICIWMDQLVYFLLVYLPIVVTGNWLNWLEFINSAFNHQFNFNCWRQQFKWNLLNWNAGINWMNQARSQFAKPTNNWKT